MSGILVAGLGSEHRRDDGAGVAVARAVASLGLELPGGVTVVIAHDPLDLLGRWEDADLAIVVDAGVSGAPAGTVSTIDLDASGPAPAATSRASTHGLNVVDALRIGRSAGAAPRRVVIVAIEGEDFGNGEGFSPAVAAAVPEAVRVVRRLAFPLVHRPSQQSGGMSDGQTPAATGRSGT